MDRGAWWATVHRVTKSWTQLKWLTTHTHTHNKICCLSEIQIQLNILYFYLQNMTILNMISQLGNSHWYNAENYRFYSVFTIYNIYSFVCEHTACFFFFSNFKNKNQKNLRTLQSRTQHSCNESLPGLPWNWWLIQQPGWINRLWAAEEEEINGFGFALL